MVLGDYIRFASENPLCYLATTEGDRPRVRAFLLWFASEEGFYFQTGSTKGIYRQLMENPRAEVCFYDSTPLPEVGKMMRVSGEVEFIEDVPLKKRLLEELAFLQELYEGPDDPRLKVFRIRSGEAHFWTMDDNLKEGQIRKTKF